MPWSSMMNMNIMPPRAIAFKNPAMFAKENIRFLKRLNRNIGSSTRLSIIGNAIKRMIPIISDAITHGLPHPIGSFP